MAVSKLNPSAGGIPFGDTAGRPANPGTGRLYSNGETARLELMTAAGSWENIVQEVPGVSGISGTYSESANSGTITINGTNFVSGAIASATGTNSVEVQASSTTYNSLVQLTAVFAGLSNAYEPYDIKVTNPSNLFGLIPDALYINASPVWQTASGSLGSFNEQVSVSVSATATDSDSTITYTLASGSSLPSGLSLNTSTGAITGTLPDISSDTTYTFTINASDGLNTIPRAFSITSLMITPTVEYLVVAGGGGGGGRHAGGGGAGGMRSGSLSITEFSHLVTVGSGGLGSTNNAGDVIVFNGENSTFSSITSLGGGRGGMNSFVVGSGGSGGGGNGNAPHGGGAGTEGQGNSGGNGGSSLYAGGGGGGAGTAGSTNNSGTGGAGGNGLANSITGTSIVYAGGGGGGGWEGNPYGVGGTGGGGAGSGTNGTDNNSSQGAKARSGTNGLGGGGGGGGIEPGSGGGDGGSGVVVIAYSNTYPAITTIPGTLTYDQPTRSGYRVYRFTAGTGTITF